MLAGLMVAWMTLQDAQPAPKGMVVLQEREPKPRESEFLVQIGAVITAAGNNQRIAVGTVIPIAWPEQSVEVEEEVSDSCRITTQKLTESASMLLIQTNPLRAGATAKGQMTLRVKVSNHRAVLKKDLFPATQPAAKGALRNYLGASPGIDHRDPKLLEICRGLAAQDDHPWDKALKYFQWVQAEIKYQKQDFTNTKTAVAKRCGDCEEKAAVFVAMCRSQNIPARLVLTEGHCWAEFYLVDHESTGHWIPAHTTLPPCFGFLPKEMVILQKGDSFRIQAMGNNTRRLVGSWVKTVGPGPKVDFIQKIELVKPEAGTKSSPPKSAKR